jgi:Sulfotransferase family
MGAEGLRLPDFFIVGQPKSGTTALYQMLRQHPDIFMAGVRSPKFFGADRADATGRRRLSLPVTLEEYAALFADAAPGQILGEASPGYLGSATAAADIAAVRPDARIIAILREPADFLRSYHLQLLEEGVEHETDLRRALQNQRFERGGKVIERYERLLDYVELLRRYETVFGSEQMLVLIYDDYRADNNATLRSVLRHVGADDSFEFELLQSNPTVTVRSQGVQRMLTNVRVGRGRGASAVHRAIKALVPRAIRRTAVEHVQASLHAPPPPPDQALMAELRVRLKPRVQELSEHLGRDLVSLWGYEQVR